MDVWWRLVCAAFTNSITPQVVSIENTINSVVNSTVKPIVAQITTYQTMLVTIVDTQVSVYDNYRYRGNPK